MTTQQREKAPYTRRQDSPLATWRVQTGLSLKAIAARLGISRMSWIRYERTGKYPNRLYPQLKRMAREIEADRKERNAGL